jgi:transcriptional regulator with XRE-family HTH domain
MKRIEKIQYDNVIVENFMKYLTNKKITQKKYANDNNLDESIVSKWKKGKSSLTINQIRQAADYFDITFNDLVYSAEEKKRIELLADKSFKPITAQHSIDVEIYDDIFQKPVKLVSVILFSLVVIALLAYASKDIIIYAPLIIILFVFVVNKEIKESSIREENFIVSYLDDIFYKRQEMKNGFYACSVLVRVLSIVAIVYILNIAVNIPNKTDVSYGISLSLLLLAVLQFFLSIFTITEIPRYFKSKIYEEDFRPYFSFRFSIIVYSSMLAMSVIYCIYDFNSFYLLLIVNIIVLLINTIDFTKLSNEYSKYILVYQEDKRETRELFPDRN